MSRPCMSVGGADHHAVTWDAGLTRDQLTSFLDNRARRVQGEPVCLRVEELGLALDDAGAALAEKWVREPNEANRRAVRPTLARFVDHFQPATSPSIP